MREFLKPTKVTIVVFTVIIFITGGCYLLSGNHPACLVTVVFMIPTIIIIIFLGVLIPVTKPGFLLMGGPNLTRFGEILVYAIYLLLVYLVATINALLYYKIKNNR